MKLLLVVISPLALYFSALPASTADDRARTAVYGNETRHGGNRSCFFWVADQTLDAIQFLL